MAPVISSNTGMTPQVVDSPSLKAFMNRLNALYSKEEPPNIEKLVQELQHYNDDPVWRFEEQADLYDWIPALNAIDAALRSILEAYPNLLLVAPLQRKNSISPNENEGESPKYATTLEQVESVPQDVVDSLCTLLRFTSLLLSNSISKNVYNSVMELCDLLGAANDAVASLALSCLSSLAAPPALHKQQAPEMQHHTTVLHNKQVSSGIHGRLLALSRGWGTRASGLGLLQVVAADDSEFGQGSLSNSGAGQVSFDYYSPSTHKEECITLTSRDILWNSDEGDEDVDMEENANKRRKVSTSGTTTTTAVKERTKSTAELYFTAIEKAGGRDKISETSLFLLLTDIRLAKAFYSQSSRIAGVENRLRALVAILYAHSSQEIVSGYFSAQPELVMELMDLLRPTVSSASVSAAAASSQQDSNLQSMGALANSPQVPYEIRSLAMDCLTALVSRRDAGSGGLTGVARQSQVLQELGVGKGLYLGLLPTLIRFSLASLTSFLASDSKNEMSKATEDVNSSMDADDAIAMDIGLAFVKATRPEPLPPGEQLRRALEFVDAVLTLTSAVVSAPSGTAALTDCGLVPALLGAVAMDASATPSILRDDSVLTPEERSSARSLLRFIMSQAIQIIEGAVVTHNNALSAFHDLNGIDILTSRLSLEMDAIRQASSDGVAMDTSGDVEMADAEENDSTKLRTIDSSQRVLLFSSVNCLTVVFHQESGTASTTPMGGVQLRKPELTATCKEIMNHVESYGGVLTALISSLLSDVMNSDPQIVHHVHSSGLADSFLAMLEMGDDTDASSSRPPVPPVAELIMGLPSTISALSLTEDGATKVLEKNPFPGLLSIFYHPEFAMPKSRCMLNEMTAIVGTGLDEIMRHVPRHQPLIMKAIVEAMQNVVGIGAKLVEQEEAMDASSQVNDELRASLEEQRTCLMQYATNFGQMLEQILHNEEHCDPFVNAGGLDPILDMFQYLIPTGFRFLANASCLSCPSVCTLAHSTTEDLLAMAFKCITMHCISGDLVAKMVTALESHLETLERIQGELSVAFSFSPTEGPLSAEGILENVPALPLPDAVESDDFASKAVCLSKYLRAVVTLQWLTNLLGAVIRTGCQRGQQSNSSWGRNEFKWKKEVFASPNFRLVMNKVARYCQSANLEVCRIRAQDEFDERDVRRLKGSPIGSSPVRYRLRIVCQEGALVRTGMEIDSCATVGSMEMGEITVAFDRSVNSSGVMRYRTSRGWVSELTRGHGREPIAEVLNVWNAQDEGPAPPCHHKDKSKKKFNCGVADLNNVSASILARLQGSYCELFSSLSRESVLSFRALSPRSVTFDASSVGGFIRGLLDLLASGIKQGITNETVTNAMASSTNSSEPANFETSDAAIAMYLGSQISLLQSCLFDDTRDRKNLNYPLLMRLLYTDEGDVSTITPSRPFFLDAIGFVFRQSLSEFQDFDDKSSDASLKLSLSRAVAASLPPAIALMHRLIPSSTLSSSTLTSVLSRLSDTDRFVLMADGTVEEARQSKRQLLYRPDYFTKAVQCAVAESLLEIWRDPRFVFAPAQVVHRVASVAKDVISAFEEKAPSSSESNLSGGRRMFSFGRQGRMGNQGQEQDNNGEEPETANFEPDEAVVTQLTDMGFSREHALDAIESTRSNRVDVAMEYVLTISTLSQEELASRRAAREDRIRRERAAIAEVAASLGRSEDGAGDDEEMADADESQNDGPAESANGDERPAESAGDKKDGSDNENESMAKRVEECRKSWIESASDVSIRVISGISATDALSSESAKVNCSNVARRDDGNGKGDAEAEALTLSLSSFLLELCQRFPEEREKIVSTLLDRLVSLFTETEANDAWFVSDESSSSFASLCHAAVLCIRALPDMRLMVLRKGIVRRLVSSIKAYSSSRAESENATWPLWLSPSLLLLDVMAQPVTVPVETAFVSNKDDDQDLSAVCDERKEKAASLAQMADKIFSSVQHPNAKIAQHVEKSEKPKTKDSGEEATSEKESVKEGDDTTEESVNASLPPFSKVPPYYPLLTEESAEASMLLCLDLLGKGTNVEVVKKCPPPSGVVQSLLSLMTTLLQSPKIASRCLDMGAVELILSLPRESRFTGNAGVSTLILRRLLEDEATLQSSMSSEIRYSMTKLMGKESRQGSPQNGSGVSIHSFVQAVTPLICRDPVSFLKAAATTVKVESKGTKGDNSAGSATVVLLTPEESTRNSKALAEALSKRDSPAPTATERRERRASNIGTKAPRRRSNSRSSSKRSLASKKAKKEKGDATGKKNGSIHGTPANQVMCHLIEKVVDLANENAAASQDAMDTQSGAVDEGIYGEATSFLWLADTLEVMANLILAVPACAAAIHRYRPPSGKTENGFAGLGVSHALRGCPSPPRTFVNFLLHSVLPQDRWTYRREQLRGPRADADTEAAKARKKLAHMTTRVAQTSARLLFALVARAGEGRRRVIADLTFALSGGHLGHTSSSSLATSKSPQMIPNDREFHALQAWGDLCIGIAAPRSNGTSNENSSSLSFEVVKLMLDFGMAHALMYAVHRVNLQHPMTAFTFATLLVPFEVFTRRSVTSSVQAVADKEAAANAKRKQTESETKLPSAKKLSEATARVSAGPSHRSEGSFADDVMLADGFDAESAARSARGEQGMEFDGGEDENMEFEAMVENEGSNDSDEAEMEVEEADDESDEEMSSDDDSGVTEDDDDDDEGSEEDSDDDEQSSSESQEDGTEEDFDDEEQEQEDGQDWEVNDDFLEGPSESERGSDRGEGMNVFGPGMDEGWTRIDPAGFGGMLLGGRRPVRAAGALPPNVVARGGRGFLDAAEAMIGSLFQNGEIDANALAEIEGTLGIRIVRPGGLQESDDQDGAEEGSPLARALGLQARDFRGIPSQSGSARPPTQSAFTSVPQVHQRSPPGFSAMSNGRWNAISAMEYIYGGPTIAAGSRNYDLSRSNPLGDEEDSYHAPMTIDMRLFPGGPAAATHSRVEPSTHPLLRGVDLPPVNSLVSDLVPHSTRAVQRAPPNTTRPMSMSSGSFLVSTQGGNVLRINRAPGGIGDGTDSQNASSQELFTDYGGGFSEAVEQAFVASMMPPNNDRVVAEEQQQPEAENASQEEPARDDTGDSPNQDTNGEPNADPIDSAAVGSAGAPSPSNQPQVNNEQASASLPADNDRPSDELAPDDSAAAAAASAGNRESSSNDGDGVASSLAAGLRLSPASEASASSDQPMAAAEAPPAVASQGDGEVPVSESTIHGAADENVPMEEDESEQQAESQVDDAAAMQEDPVPDQQAEPQAETAAAEAQEGQREQNEPLVCPPGMDEEVFNSLPIEMQREVVEQNQAAADVAGQLDAASGLDPEALAALPEDMRREVIEQEQRERRAREREQVPADPSNAEEMDNASFLASLAPELRRDILLTSDEGFINSLPPNMIAEANILRDRASMLHRRENNDGGVLAGAPMRGGQRVSGAAARSVGSGGGTSSRRKLRPGKMKVDCDRSQILYIPTEGKQLSPLPGISDMKMLLRLLYLRTPVRPSRVLQRVFHNICSQRSSRNVLCTAIVQLLNENSAGAVAALESIENEYNAKDDWRAMIDAEFRKDESDFPPGHLIGAPPEVVDNEDVAMFGRRTTGSAGDSTSASLPTSAMGSNEEGLPPVVATTLIDTLLTLSKGSPRLCIDALQNELVGSKLHESADRSLIFDKLLDLLDNPRYTKSATNLEQLLTLIEIMVSPLSLHPRIGEEEHEISQRDIDAAASSGKEYIEVPRIVVSQPRLQLLCSVLRMESCRDVAFGKVNSIARRLCRVEENRGYILGELGAVAQSLATDAIRDLRTLNIRMQDAVTQQEEEKSKTSNDAETMGDESKSKLAGGSASNSVTLSVSGSEVKLLRVLQTLQSLCVDATDESSLKKDGMVVVTDELVEIVQSMKLGDLWKNLDSCLHVVKVLEGVKTVEEMDDKNSGDDDASDDGPDGKKLQNSVAGLLTRFLPIIEAFFVVNASSRSAKSAKSSKQDADKVSKENIAEDSGEQGGEAVESTEGSTEAAPGRSQPSVTTSAAQQKTRATADDQLDSLIGGRRLVEFVQSNRVLLNALIRNNPSLLEKALRSLVFVPRCRALLDFDVKRHWFKTQVRRLRQQASRRYGSLRLGIRRKFVFEDAYHQLRLRNADEMRGRLHITFRDEEGVDAGGLSREFFGILGKEIFNPNYALFTSTEDGCTFQPNPNSSINPDHLSYFRFVGRIVGKAVADGFLLDAHFTRSLYKHMLGQKPTVGDMEAIDPDYYKNLQMILEHNLDDIGLELTFSAEDFSFGRRDIIDLIPNGRNIAVTEETKEKYVSLVCEHRMTTAISSQIKAYLDGFYEMVNRDLIAIFTPRELELLISGLPDIDVVDLKRNTEYQGYRPTDKEIQWFWNVLFSLSRSEKAAFLQFVTGSSKVPLAGFAELQGMRGVQKFSIHKAGGESGSLMSAHTCFNSLDLPVYKSEEELREKLLYAISEGQGAFMFA